MSELGQPDHLIHCSVSYRTAQDYLDSVLPFLSDGLAAGEPPVVIAPESNIDLLQGALDNASREQVTFLNAADVGRNPARIIPAAREFAATHPQHRIRVVGEPIWPGQPAKQIREGIRHEACVNTLFADIDSTVLCPYDVRLGAAVLAAAEQTHPYRIEQGTYRHNSGYVPPTVTLDRWDQLSPTPAEPDSWTVHEGHELAALRRMVQDRGAQAGLDSDRCQDLVLAVDSALTSALADGRPPATLRGWVDDRSLVYEVRSNKVVPDPFAGRLAPPPDAGQGFSFWLTNHACDLVELRPYPWGTVIRMHIDHNGTG